MKNQLNTRVVLLAAAMTTFATAAFGQAELTVSAGATEFLGDVGGKPGLGTHDMQDLDLHSTRYNVGLGTRIHLSELWSIRVGGYYARVSGDDKYTSNPERRNRNLNFFSPVFGGNLMMEFNLPKNGEAGKWYLLGGIEYFHFDPRTRYNGQVVRLAPLGTEGQYFMQGRSPYKLHSLAIPFGIGYKFLDAARSSLSCELVLRKTFTDYMDDVSTTYVDKTQLIASNGQLAADLSDRSLGDIPYFSYPGNIRGHSQHMDNFFFLNLTYSYKFGQRKPSGASFYRPHHSHHRHYRSRRSSGDGF